IVVGTFTVIFTILAILLVREGIESLAARSQLDTTELMLVSALIIDSILLCSSLAALLKKKYMLGGMLTIVGGVCTLPVGAILIFAGIQIRSLATKIENAEFVRSLGLENTPV